MEVATHGMVQRSAQMELDLDHTAAMLCDEMTQGAESNAAMIRLRELYVREQSHCRLAMAALSGLKIQLCIRDQELHQSKDQLSEALVSLQHFKAIRLLLCQ